MVEILSIFDTDEIWELGRIVETAIPARETAAFSERRSQLAVLGVCDRFELPVDVVGTPRHAECLVPLLARRLRARDKRRVAQADDPVGRVDLQAHGSSRASRAILCSRSGTEFGRTRNPRAVRQRQHVAITAV